MSSLKDVAQEAGVSISTVSRALNNPDQVRLETREYVEKVAREMGYQPNRVARRLRVKNGQRDGRAHLLGLIIPDLQNSFYADVVSGVEDVAYAQDYSIILCNSNEDPEREHFYLDVLEGESVDGVILPPICSERKNEKEKEFFASMRIPAVCFDRRPPVPLDTVVVDNRLGAREATEHLIKLGHRRIGAIFGPTSISTSSERMEGFHSTLESHGVTVEEELSRVSSPTREAGRESAKKLLSRPDPPTALFVTNTQLILGTLEATEAMGLSTPGDVALVGFDDPPWAGLLATPLTTVRQPSYEMGRRAADLLLRRLADSDRPSQIVELEPSLVVRASCGIE